jgi:hypothetical protein
MLRKVSTLISIVLVALISLSPITGVVQAEADDVHGLAFELSFNPSGPEFEDGRLNPFAVPAIREAMNLLIDRSDLEELVFEGSGRERWLPITTFGKDYEDLLAICNALEAQYAYDFDGAEAIISQEMDDLGAVKTGELWHYEDDPVEIIFLILEEDVHKAIGDFVADLLEELGFTVDRQYKSAIEAHLIWNLGDPAEGEWHIYTSSWVLSTIMEDESPNFQFYYTPDSFMGIFSPLWQAYAPTAEFQDLANQLAEDDFTDEQERQDAMADALGMAMEDSVRVWLLEIAYTSFEDVPLWQDYYDWIERLVDADITDGCTVDPPKFCPDQVVTRAQMAIFLERGMHFLEENYTPPAAVGDIFEDVFEDDFAADWIEALFEDGITTGCGDGKFCPDEGVTRSQMAIFLLRGKYGGEYTPPPVDGETGFDDVPADHWAAAWIKQLADEGITAGCGNNNFCPDGEVTRAQMAVFLVRAFDLP